MNDIKNTELQQWLELDQNAISQVVHHTWSPYNPEIGIILKTEIVKYFGAALSDKVLQFGLKTFGWGDYMLFAIVEDSKVRIPKNFANLFVNKGVVKEKLEGAKYIVKFNYGGKMVVEIENQISIN